MNNGSKAVELSDISKIVSAARDILFSLDINKKITFVSPAFERILKISTESVIGLNFIDILHGDDQVIINEEFSMEARPDENSDVYCRMSRIDGMWRTFSLNISPCCIDDGPVAWVVNARDMTDHRKMDEIMMLAEKMNMLGGLVAGMAHELNNPLGSIIQNAQNIERRLSPELPANISVSEKTGVDLKSLASYLNERGISQFISHIKEAGIRATSIIMNLMQFVRRSESSPEVVDCNMLAEKAIELILSDYDMKKKCNVRLVNFVKNYSEKPISVRVSTAEIEQVLFNILANAVQALHGAETACPSISVSTIPADGFAMICIQDNGPGMDEVTKRHIFDPFFSTKPPGSGTGLGLTVAYAIVSRGYGGKLEVESEKDKGTKFMIQLPLAV